MKTRWRNSITDYGGHRPIEFREKKNYRPASASLGRGELASQNVLSRGVLNFAVGKN